MMFQLVHLIDPVTFECDSKRTAQMVAILLGQGHRELVEGEDGIELVLNAFAQTGADPAEITGVSDPGLWYEEHRLEVMAVLRTVMPGTVRDREAGRGCQLDGSPTCVRADRIVTQIARGIAA